jgi:serine/threonine protein kinase
VASTYRLTVTASKHGDPGGGSGAEGTVVREPADIWGIGAVLYETAAGVPPYVPADRRDPYPMLHGPPPPVRTHRRMPRALAAAIDSCFAADPPNRPTSRELDTALAEHAG